MGCTRRGDSFPVCTQKAEHHLSELQRPAWAAAISSDTRDGYEMLTLLLQPPRILCASTGQYTHTHTHTHTYTHIRSLCSPPLPECHDPGTTSPGEHMVCPRLLQHHDGLCHRRLPHIPIITTVPLPPPGMSEQEPSNQPLLYHPPVWVGNRCLRVTYTQR